MPAGVSLRQILHFAQLIRSGKFRRFEYDNVYGPPSEFDLSKISTPINLYMSEDDTTTTIANIQELQDRLPNVIKSHVVSGLEHSDFVYSRKAADLVYKPLIADMKRNDQLPRNQRNAPINSMQTKTYRVETNKKLLRSKL